VERLHHFHKALRRSSRRPNTGREGVCATSSLIPLAPGIVLGLFSKGKPASGPILDKQGPLSDQQVRFGLEPARRNERHSAPHSCASKLKFVDSPPDSDTARPSPWWTRRPITFPSPRTDRCSKASPTYD